jgi:hypothetical protein
MHRTHKSQQEHRKVLHFLAMSLIAALVVATLLPLSSPSVSAADDDESSLIVPVRIEGGLRAADKGLPGPNLMIDPSLIDPGTLGDPPSPEPTVVVDPDFSDTVIDPDVLDPDIILTPDLPVAGGVQINKLWCNEDYGGDYYQLAANCSPDGLATFHIYGTDAEQSADGGFVSVNVATPDTITIVEDLPAGYAAPIVYCDVYAPTEPGPTDFQLASVLWYSDAVTMTEHAKVSYDLGTGDFLYCDWFNVPLTGDGSIYVNKHGCPAGFDASTASYYDLAANCHDTMNGIQFDLSGPVSASQATGDVVDSGVVFDNLPAGSYSVAEQLPEGYNTPVVFCHTESLTGESGESFQPYQEGSAFALELGDGVMMFCDWFNIPSGDDDGGVVIVHKWECPPGTDPVADDFSQWGDYQATCTTPMDGVSFLLVTEGDIGLPQVTGSGGVDGEAVWTGLGPGPITLGEDVPSGYGQPVVFCGWGAIYDEDGDGIAVAVDGIVPPSAVEGNVLNHELLPNEQMLCDWFNIPTGDDDMSIIINKWTCPAGYDIWAPGADPASDCTSKTNGVTFMLRHEGMVDLQTTTGDSIDGAVRWGGLDAGDYTVDEDVPAGTGAILVTCTWYEALGPYVYDTLVPDDAGVISLSLAEGDDIVCDWFNVPVPDDPGGHLTVIKYWCDNAAMIPGSCAIYGGGAGFVVQAASGEGDPVFFVTGSDGTATISLPAGAYTLQESGRAWCYASSADVDGSGYVTVSNGHESVVKVYNCGPGKKKNPPVKKFPNTGSGPGSVSPAVAAGMHSGTAIGFGLVSLMILFAGRIGLLAVRTVGIRP